MAKSKLKQAFFQVLDSSRKRLNFKHIGYLPRWVILGFDFLILVVALVLTKVVVANIKDQFFTLTFSKTEVVIIVINVIFFILYRTYAGLIRHSTFLDAVRFLVASVSTLITLFVVYYVALFYNDTSILSIPFLLIYINYYMFRYIQVLDLIQYHTFEINDIQSYIYFYMYHI